MTHLFFPFIPSRSWKQGFTLLELLISMTVLSVIVVLLLGITNGASQHWSDGQRRREASREARAALEFLTEDLHEAVLTTNPVTLFISDPKEKQEGERLSFLVSQSEEKSLPGNNLAAVSYFVAKAPDATGNLNLYRFHLSGSQVNEAFAKNSLEKLFATASAENKITTELLARNIVKLEVHRISDPSSLFISISAIGGETAKQIASDLKATERNARLLQQRTQRYSTVIALPSLREFSPVNR